MGGKRKRLIIIISVIIALLFCVSWFFYNVTDYTNPEKLIGKNRKDIVFLNLWMRRGTHAFMANYTKKYDGWGYVYKDKVVVYLSIHETGEVVDYYFSPFVKYCELEKCIGMSYDEMTAKIGRPFDVDPFEPELNIITNYTGEYSFCCTYQQKYFSFSDDFGYMLSPNFCQLFFDDTGHLIYVEEIIANTRP